MEAYDSCVATADPVFYMRNIVLGFKPGNRSLYINYQNHSRLYADAHLHDSSWEEIFYTDFKIRKESVTFE